MRVLLSTIGSRGDVQPLVALALQLKTLGQEVHLCVPPDFRDWIVAILQLFVLGILLILSYYLKRLPHN
ncbi:MAG: glycosyltransferase [Anaerolineae bacterium]|nr:glycosyltransferase [Anaerolineae bacterium]